MPRGGGILLILGCRPTSPLRRGFRATHRASTPFLRDASKQQKGPRLEAARLVHLHCRPSIAGLADLAVPVPCCISTMPAWLLMALMLGFLFEPSPALFALSAYLWVSAVCACACVHARFCTGTAVEVTGDHWPQHRC